MLLCLLLGMVSVILVRPPVDDWYQADQYATGFRCGPPSGLLYLAAAIKDIADVRVIDGYREVDWQGPHKADFVGATSLFCDYQNALSVLKNANGMRLLGGAQAYPLAERILAARPFVDAVVRGDGEDALRRLVAGDDPACIENVVSRGKDGAIVSNPSKRVTPGILYDLSPMESPESYEGKEMDTSFIRGCIWAQRNGRCDYCSLLPGVRVMAPAEKPWAQIRLLRERYNAARIFETGDTFMVGNYPRRLLEARPKDLADVTFRVYLNPTDLAEENIALLAELGVREAFVGVEHAVPEILERAGKKLPRNIVQQLLNVQRHGIRTHVPFLYGLAGETVETMQANYRLACELAERADAALLMMTSSVVIPLPGSPYFEDLMNQATHLRQQDAFHYRSLTEQHLERQTRVSLREAQGMVEQTLALVDAPEHKTTYRLES